MLVVRQEFQFGVAGACGTREEFAIEIDTYCIVFVAVEIGHVADILAEEDAVNHIVVITMRIRFLAIDDHHAAFIIYGEINQFLAIGAEQDFRDPVVTRARLAVFDMMIINRPFS